MCTVAATFLLFSWLSPASWGETPQANPPLPAPAHALRTVVPQPPGPSLLGAVRAVVIKSWSNGTASAWAQLNLEWPQHGSIPIEVDTTALVGDFTYEALAATNADVVILSDPAGGVRRYTAAEVAAVRRYAEEGHNLLATYLAFRWSDVDNSALAPIFGLRADLAYPPSDVPSLTNEFHVMVHGPLTKGLVGLGPGDRRRPNQWPSTGYPYSEVPADDRRWDAADFAGAMAVAQCDARTGIVTVYKTPTYVGIFVSNMPEYFGGFLDKQLLYNAIVHPRPRP